MEEDQGRSSRVINDDVHAPVLVNVRRKHAERCHPVALEEWALLQGKRRVAVAGALQGGDDNLVSPGVDVAGVVREAVAVQVIERDGSPYGREERRDALDARVDPAL